MKELDSTLLLGCWRIDASDQLSLQSVGDAQMEFRRDGTLEYTIRTDQKKHTTLLTYGVEQNFLVSNQPSHPEKGRTRILVLSETELVLSYDGEPTRFVREESLITLAALRAARSKLHTVQAQRDFGWFGIGLGVLALLFDVGAFVKFGFVSATKLMFWLGAGAIGLGWVNITINRDCRMELNRNAQRIKNCEERLSGLSQPDGPSSQSRH